MNVKGVDHYRYVDPMYECIRIVLARRGNVYSPEYIQGISGMAFRIAGPCPCAPTCSVAMSPAELVRQLGYAVEESGLEKLPRNDVAAAVPGVVSRIKNEIDAGRPVIVWHAFTNAEYDVVAGYDDEAGTFLGFGSYKGGPKGPASANQTRLGDCLDICPAYGALIIGAKTGEFRARDAELDAMEEAVRFAHSPRDRFLDEKTVSTPPWRMREGLACYDIWIRQFELDPQKTPGGPSDRYPLGVYASTRRAAPGFLREIASKYPDAETLLKTAADCFQEDADALNALRSDVGWGWGPDSWKKPDPVKAAKSVELLRKARDAYRRGTDALQLALKVIDPARLAKAEMHVRVRREGNRAWIDDMPDLAFGRGKDNTFCGALWLLTRVSDHPYDYSDLMGLSGLAFRTRWANDATKTKWCPSITIGEMPDEQNALRRATGLELPMEWQAPKDAGEKLRKRIVAEIDAGRPVMTYTPAWINAVICGYEGGGTTVLVNDYQKEEKLTPVPLDSLGVMRHYLGKQSEPKPLRDCLHDVLRIAVDHWRKEKHHGGLPDREYWYGKAALEAWIGDLRNYDRLSESSQRGVRDLGAMNLQTLLDARQAASRFLKDWSCLVDGDERAALLKAADIYEKISKGLAPVAEDNDASREKQIETLLDIDIRRLEEQAIATIEAALKAAGVSE